MRKSLILKIYRLGFKAGFKLGQIVACLKHRRIRLNLVIEGPETMNVGQTVTATISPTAAGQPATVTNVKWDVAPGGAFNIAPAADGMSAVYTATVAGTGFIAEVSAVNAEGVTLTDQAALPDVGQPAADALNLKIGPPV